MELKAAIVGAMVAMFACGDRGTATNYDKDNPPFMTVSGDTAYTVKWREALACVGVDGERKEPAVKIMVPDRIDSQGHQGFACSGSPTGCYGTIEGGEVRVAPDLAGLPHEFAHAACWYRTGGYGMDGNGCYGVKC